MDLNVSLYIDMFIYMNYNHLKALEKLYGLKILKMERCF